MVCTYDPLNCIFYTIFKLLGSCTTVCLHLHTSLYLAIMSLSDSEEVFSNTFSESTRGKKRPRQESEDIIEMKEKMGGIDEKLERVLEAVGAVGKELEGLRGTVGKILKCAGEHETRLKKIEDKLERQCVNVKDLNKTVSDFDKRVGGIEVKLNKVERTVKCVESLDLKIKEMERKLIDFEARGRRNNLLFHGIAETSNEDCANLVKNVLRDKCGVRGEVVIERAHRQGVVRRERRQGGKPRPIIARLLNYNDVVAAKKGKKKLPAGISISDDLPAEIREARGKLVPELQELKRQNKNAWIAYPARLMLDGHEEKRIEPVTSPRDNRGGARGSNK